MRAASALVVALAATASAQFEDDSMSFDVWVGAAAKTYSSPEESAYRREIFDANSQRVQSHNAQADDLGFTMGLNQFADLTSDEWASLYTSRGLLFPESDPAVAGFGPESTDEDASDTSSSSASSSSSSTSSSSSAVGDAITGTDGRPNRIPSADKKLRGSATPTPYPHSYRSPSPTKTPWSRPSSLPSRSPAPSRAPSSLPSAPSNPSTSSAPLPSASANPSTSSAPLPSASANPSTSSAPLPSASANPSTSSAPLPSRSAVVSRTPAPVPSPAASSVPVPVPTPTGASVDWQQLGMVTSVKNQGSCGSCYSFGTSGAIESYHAIKGNPLVSLSQQQIIDCTNNMGCGGGYIIGSLQYGVNGLCSEASYPYTSSKGSCRASTCAVVARTTGYKNVAASQAALEAAVRVNPVTVAVDASGQSWQFYKSGVVTTGCSTALNHAVLLVGFGADATTGAAFYRIKNSWGASWGEQGYIRLGRGAQFGSAGVCGLQMQAAYPV